MTRAAGEIASSGAWIALATILWAASAAADGNVAIAGGDAGPFRVDVLVAPFPPRVGLAEWSVLVRDGADGEIALDTQVALSLWPAKAAHAAHAPQRFAATRQLSANRLLHSVRMELPHAGPWRGTARVRRGEVGGELSFELDVAPPLGVLAENWAALALPVLGLVGFALHQWRTHRLR